MVIRKVGAMSLAKILGVIYGTFGLIAGLVVSLITLLGAGFGNTGAEGLWAVLFGLGAVVFIPIFYGLIGALGGALSGWIFNLATGFVGGLEVDVEP